MWGWESIIYPGAKGKERKGKHFCLYFSRNVDANYLAFNLINRCYYQIRKFVFMGDHFETPTLMKPSISGPRNYSDPWNSGQLFLSS